MGSLRITTLRESFPGMTDQSAAAAYAEKHGYVAIVRYKNAPSSADFTDVGTCDSEEAIQAYLRSPNCHGAEIIYDGRSTLFALTADHVLSGRCQICAKRATLDTFEMGSGNDFYFCPKCGLLFCESCYTSLPLTNSPGYGTCPSCRIEVKRAISYFFARDIAVSPAAPEAAARKSWWRRLLR